MTSGVSDINPCERGPSRTLEAGKESPSNWLNKSVMEGDDMFKHSTVDDELGLI